VSVEAHLTNNLQVLSQLACPMRRLARMVSNLWAVMVTVQMPTVGFMAQEPTLNRSFDTRRPSPIACSLEEGKKQAILILTIGLWSFLAKKSS
jgi:hypothetical protein